MTALTYVPLNSSVNPSFWSKLSQLLLDVYKADEIDRNIWGQTRLIEYPHLPTSMLEIDSTSFNAEFSSHATYIPFHGKFINTNTIEKFKECDKQRLINAEGLNLYEKIKTREVLENPSLLNWFLLLTYSDIKKYQFYYWFAFPVPQNVIIHKLSSGNITTEFTDNMIFQLYTQYQSLNHRQSYYFLAYVKGSSVALSSLEEGLGNICSKEMKVYFVFVNIAPKDAVGSQLRNFVAFLLYHCPFLANEEAQFLALNFKRDRPGLSVNRSTIYRLLLPGGGDYFLKWVGWEKNERDNFGPRLANMRNNLDPAVISEISNDLNLKLMKWNLIPDLNLDKIKATKCLLLGSGTLGCSVARTLLGWGVRHITFVDNSTVSASNPVRQSLFTFQDAINSKPKAQAAADGLKLISPAVISTGYQLTIPMPGHPVSESFIDQTTEDLKTLTHLIDTHNVIFLLLDSRESRWLPTLLGASKRKIVINAALGFDSYLVMRHGIHTETNAEHHPEEPPFPCPEGFKLVKGSNLGCYFCTDVVAPGDSMKNRTLDKQCTVTRPGVSQIAGALAAELAVSLTVHQDGVSAPAFYVSKQNVNDLDIQKLCPSQLGLVPHSIRGFISSYEQFCPATEKYNNCVACSDFIVRQYEENGNRFLFDVFENSKILEELAGIPKMMTEIQLSDIYECSAEEDFSDGWSTVDVGDSNK